MKSGIRIQEGSSSLIDSRITRRNKDASIPRFASLTSTPSTRKPLTRKWSMNAEKDALAFLSLFGKCWCCFVPFIWIVSSFTGGFRRELSYVVCIEARIVLNSERNKHQTFRAQDHRTEPRDREWRTTIEGEDEILEKQLQACKNSFLRRENQDQKEKKETEMRTTSSETSRESREEEESKFHERNKVTKHQGNNARTTTMTTEQTTWRAGETENSGNGIKTKSGDEEQGERTERTEGSLLTS